MLEDIKKHAERDRDAEQRLLWAERAVDVALHSASVDLFKSVLEWTRRFLRDPVITIYYLIHFVYFSNS